MVLWHGKSFHLPAPPCMTAKFILYLVIFFFLLWSNRNLREISKKKLFQNKLHAFVGLLKFDTFFSEHEEKPQVSMISFLCGERPSLSCHLEKMGFGLFLLFITEKT